MTVSPAGWRLARGLPGLPGHATGIPMALRRPLKALLAPPRSWPASVTVMTAIGAVEVDVRASPRARRVSLKFDPPSAAFELVVPPGPSLKQALGSARQHAGWLAA